MRVSGRVLVRVSMRMSVRVLVRVSVRVSVRELVRVSVRVSVRELVRVSVRVLVRVSVRVLVRELVRVSARVSGVLNDMYIYVVGRNYVQWSHTYTRMPTPSSMTIAATSAVLEGSQAKSE